MNKEFTTFPNAPITEAVLDIRVELPEEVDLKDLETFQASIKERFPEKKEQRIYEGVFQISKEGFSTIPPQYKINGYLFETQAEKKIVQARLDGFTLNKLKPYENWDSFRDEGRELWELYSKMFQPNKIIRIALRYINKIEIPLPLSFEEYFSAFPQMPDSLPQGIANFLMQIDIPNVEIEAYARITLATEETTEGKLPMLFDIDVSRNSIYVDNKEKIWSDFEKIRIFKNEIFLNSITDKTKELFK